MRKGMSANDIKWTLGVSYKTAWYLCHRIRDAMAFDPFHGMAIQQPEQSYIFPDTLARIMRTDPLQYRELTA